MAITLPEFVSNWQKSTLTERAASQSHFIQLCEILGEPTPAETDPEGTTYTFERGVSKSDGGEGWADVWKRGYFGWEYKGKHKDLNAAYKQLLQYREDLDNPPLLITCDLNRFEVHTNFTNTPPLVYRFDLEGLRNNEPTSDCPIRPLDVLRFVFNEPDKLKPGLTTQQVTEEAAAQFSILAKSLRDRGVPPEKGAHFLMRLLFCLFSEDVGLLPGKLFTRLVTNNLNKPADFDKKLKQLFAAMSAPNGTFGADDIPYFNGGLFSDDQTYELSPSDLGILAKTAALDWAHVEPAIFGTLFERSLDPGKRSQLGAHYTSKDDIMLIVEPVVMAPLRRRWEEIKKQAEDISDKAKAGKGAARTKLQKKLRQLLMGFADEVSKVTVLDPACGSGNFLYVALKSLLDLEKQISSFAAQHGLSYMLTKTDPSRLYGIEINVYAHELASVVVWIGYLQWQYDNGFPFGDSPILKPLKNIERKDAVLAYVGGEAEEEANVGDNSSREAAKQFLAQRVCAGNAAHSPSSEPALAGGTNRLIPVEPEWPKADFIIGNPPFLGDKKMREGLGDAYVDDLRTLYEGRVPGGADFVTYWFERARAEIETCRAKRAGLLATNSVTQVGNRPILERLLSSGGIFMAWRDRPWVLDGANVRVSMVGFDNGSDKVALLDGEQVPSINADLRPGAQVSSAEHLVENEGICFLGMMKGGPFEIREPKALSMLAAPPNPNGRPNADVVKKRLMGLDVVRRPTNTWIIDFREMSEAEAAFYELPFEYVRAVVKPVRDTRRDQFMKTNWWLHGRSRPALRAALTNKPRCIVTPEVAKHRIFVWMASSTVPDHTLHVIARSDDYFFGVLSSRIHVLWTLRVGSTLEDRPRYTSTATFDTFPFPWPPGKEPKDDPRVQTIAAAAKELVEKRDAWLNPLDACESELKKRTLTNLYNQRPQWLDNLHKALDAAVFAAYGWPDNLTDTEILERLLALNHERAEKQAKAKQAAG